MYPVGEAFRDISNLTEMAYLGILFHLFEFKDVPEEQIKMTGYEEIPKEWPAVIKKREWIEGMCEGLEW